ncbi:MAG: PorV/PorQ family protein [Bacteroidetes bacterium]|nr:PorV/PorQ family protein [Bacteroidota bacterium]HET6243279.1 PorV/PorQ family protein [Bacteroidia bacterium]
MLKKLALSIILFVSITVVYAQTARKYSNEFLSIGVGARALGMSNSYVSSVDDVTAGYWNPAGLLGVKSNRQVALMHAEYFAGIAKYDYAAFAAPLDTNSALGFSFIRFGVDNIPNTTELIDANGNINYDRITSFSAADYAFIASYAKKTAIPGLHLGANAKVIHRIVGDFAKAWGFGLDFGAQYQVGNWKFGAMARDVTSTFNAWSYTLNQETIDVFNRTGNEIPQNSVEVTLPKLLVGAARTYKIKEKFTLLTEANFDFTFDRKRNVLIKSNAVSIDPHLGLEIGYGGFVFLRAGIGNIQQQTDLDKNKQTSMQPNMGIGVKIKGITIDYALTDIGDQSVALYSNIFSLKFDINRENR